MVDQFKFNHKKVNDSIIYRNKNEGKGKLILKIVASVKIVLKFLQIDIHIRNCNLLVNTFHMLTFAVRDYHDVAH
jgi:hypothetical protein